MNAAFTSPMPSTMRLYDDKSRRLYINADERARFLVAAEEEQPEVRAFCLTLFYTGCRLSEARELRFLAIQAQARLISFRSLKKTRPPPYPRNPCPASAHRNVSSLASLTALADLDCQRTEGQSRNGL